MFKLKMNHDIPLPSDTGCTAWMCRLSQGKL